MEHYNRSDQDRRRGRPDPRKTPRMIQHWLVLLLIGFASGTTLVGLWAANTWGTQDLRPRIILYRAIALELLLTAILAVIAHQMVTRYLLAPLRRLADYDDLTDLLRPGAFWERAEESIVHAASNNAAISFIFLDLDDFKQVNDTYGHAVGDVLLQTFGKVLREHARAEDIVGRLGGEEFGWLMVGASGDDARAAALRVLEVCRTLPVEQLVGFGFSAGIASDTPSLDSSPRAWELARHADLGLYQAKTNGKGQVVVKNPKEPLQA